MQSRKSLLEISVTSDIQAWNEIKESNIIYIREKSRATRPVEHKFLPEPKAK